VGVPPALLDELVELIEAEDAALVQVDHDEEGSVRVCFHLAPGDQGSWLRDVTRRFGCGLVPAPKC